MIPCRNRSGKYYYLHPIYKTRLAAPSSSRFPLKSAIAATLALLEKFASARLLSRECHALFNFLDRLSGVQPFRTRPATVHDRVAAIQAHAVV